MPYKDPIKQKEYRRKWMNKKYHSDPIFRRKTINNAIQHQKKHPQKSTENWKKYYKTPKGKYKLYKRRCKHSNRIFDLTLKQFTVLLNKKCSYCGKTQANGIDRIKNEIGYTTKNSTPCCSVCNYMKHTLTKENFINQCNLIIKNTKHK